MLKGLISFAIVLLSIVGLLVTAPFLWLFGKLDGVTGKEAAAMGLAGITSLVAANIASGWYQSRYPKESRGFPLDGLGNIPSETKPDARPARAKREQIVRWVCIGVFCLIILVQIVRRGMLRHWRFEHSQPAQTTKQLGGKR